MNALSFKAFWRAQRWQSYAPAAANGSIKIHADPLYQHLIVTSDDMAVWRADASRKRTA